MTRSFTRDKISTELVDVLVGLARLAPRAGNTHGIEFLILENSHVDEYWETTFNEKNRDDFPWPNLFNVPVLILIWVDPKRYVERYSEGDKRRSGLGKGALRRGQGGGGGAAPGRRCRGDRARRGGSPGLRGRRRG